MYLSQFKIYLFKLKNEYVPTSKYICLNCKIHMSQFQYIFALQITAKKLRIQLLGKGVKKVRGFAVLDPSPVSEPPTYCSHF